MYRIKTQIDLAVSHRLSKHKEDCKNIHGHNLKIIVCVRSPVLDENDMVVDFKELKNGLKYIHDFLDHALLLNKDDEQLKRNIEAYEKTSKAKIHIFPHDPTAEKIAEGIFYSLAQHLLHTRPNVSVDYVEVYENERNSVRYDGVYIGEQ